MSPDKTAKENVENPHIDKSAEESAFSDLFGERQLCYIQDEISESKVDEIHENVCLNDEDFTEHTDGNKYCLFHLPSKDKDCKNKFTDKFKKRLETIKNNIDAETNEIAKQKINYDFRYVWFPSYVGLAENEFTTFADFNSATFTALADFSSATFKADVNFSSATFTVGASFVSATFEAGADFGWGTFEEKSQMFFYLTKCFGKLSFNYTNFKGYLTIEGEYNNRLFVGEKSLLDLQNARIDDAKKISFHTLRLEPSWFVNTDAKEFVFTDCKWNYADGGRLKVKRELANLDERWFGNPNALLTKTCWQLADNHEESKSFAKASLFRKFACESRRLENPWYRQPFTLNWWYYAVSFYGERWTRAVFMLIGILVLFSLLYAAPFSKFDYGTNPPKPAETFVGKVCDKLRIAENPDAMTVCDGIVHSLAVASFQRPEPKAADTLTKFLVTLEIIFAPLQAALLALAIRRKFMR